MAQRMSISYKMIKPLQQQLKIKKYYEKHVKTFILFQGSRYRFVEMSQVILKKEIQTLISFCY